MRRKDRGHVDWAGHPEYDEFLAGFIPGHTEREIASAFEERFGIRLTRSQVKNAKQRTGVRSGTVPSRFEKGHVPANKGRTWDEMGIPEETRERMRRGQFKPGALPHNALGLPIGSERVVGGGYIEVKVAERPSGRGPAHDNWVPKQRLVWEEANGRELSADEIVVFADGDNRNFDPGNLVAMTKAEHAVIVRQGLSYADRATCETARTIARLKMAAAGAELRPRRCGECGREFRLRFKGQRRCDRCLGRE